MHNNVTWFSFYTDLFSRATADFCRKVLCLCWPSYWSNYCRYTTFDIGIRYFF